MDARMAGIRTLTVLYGVSQLFFGVAALVAPGALTPSTDPTVVAHVASYVAARNLPIAVAMFVLATRGWDRVHGAPLLLSAAVQALDAVNGLRALSQGAHQIGAVI